MEDASIISPAYHSLRLAEALIVGRRLTAGTTVIEQQPKGQAAEEIRAILSELRESITV